MNGDSGASSVPAYIGCVQSHEMNEMYHFDCKQYFLELGASRVLE